MKVLVISDTHNYLPIDIEKLGCDAVIHAGDIGDDRFFNDISRYDSFYAVAGNTDSFLINDLPETLCGNIGGVAFFLVHNLAAPHRIISSIYKKICDCSPEIVFFGHTHVPFIEKREGIIYLNPGSLGKAGLTGLRSYAVVEIISNVVTEIKIFDAQSGNVVKKWSSE